VYEKTQA
jgi:CRP-like cAMP-binding protein